MERHDMTAGQSYDLVKHVLRVPEFSSTAEQVLAKRYLRRVAGPTGETLEAPSQMFWRVAWAAAQNERAYPESPWHDDVTRLALDFYNLMAEKRFLPNSPTLMNAGTDMGQLAACFVLPVPDSMEGIFDAVKHAALVHKTGGGTGFSFSNLRPKGAVVRSTSGVASGPVSFARVFDVATEQVKQGGKRRGANMGVLRVDHPDIIEFIQCKDTPGVLENFNLSVGLTAEFMDSLEENYDAHYNLICPTTGTVTGSLPAREVWGLIVSSAWRRGDPGVLFLDAINRANPTPALGRIEATNPCGELPLLPYEACNLGSINLAAYNGENGSPGNVLGLDLLRLKLDVETAVRFLDNVIDISRYPLPEVTEMVKKTRKVGLGVMGWADTLFQAGKAYDSEAAVDFAGKVMAVIKDVAWAESRRLAVERGECPALPGSGRRNASLTTIAPTGTLSILAGCSSGIEPLFALVMERRIMDDNVFLEAHEGFRKELRRALTGQAAEDVCKELAAGRPLSGMTLVPERMRRVYVTAMDVAPQWHLRMQAAFQRHVDSAVSKTVNMPYQATMEQVDHIYREAYRLGCKGVTIFRDGCRGAGNQVLSTMSVGAPLAGALIAGAHCRGCPCRGCPCRWRPKRGRPARSGPAR